jgi:hypothetical protein
VLTVVVQEHVGPFLKPVSAKEAPTYHEVIKEPMDLQTLAKNLEGLKYWSKAEFEKDLNLIFTNCYTFNAAPVRWVFASFERRAFC